MEPTAVTAIYTRVSTGAQSVEGQLQALRAYAQARGLKTVDEYVDHGISGTKARRPALGRLMAAARKRKIDRVVVVKLDRLARSVRHLVEMAGEFEALNVDLIVTDQAIDTSTPSGRLLFHVLSSIAEFERDLIRERTKAGVAAARRRGRHPGRPRALDSAAVARAKRLAKNGKTGQEIAALLGCSAATAHRAVRVRG